MVQLLSGQTERLNLQPTSASTSLDTTACFMCWWGGGVGVGCWLGILGDASSCNPCVLELGWSKRRQLINVHHKTQEIAVGSDCSIGSRY